MRKFFTTLKSVVATAVIASMTLAASCSYDDSAIKDDLNKVQQEVDKVERDLAALTERVAALESKLQSEVDALKNLIDGKVVVVEVTTDADGNKVIKLSNGDEVTVFAPTECQCEPAEPCDCDPLQYREVDGVLEVSADGENWVAINGVSADCVVADIVLNDDNTATITLANGETFTVVKAELIECEAARSQVYVMAASTKAVAFSINDAVVDINVMNQPLGWSATVTEAVAEDNGGAMPLAAGGKDYVLNIAGPSKEFVAAGYAAKEGIVSVHFNTAAGGCKVLSVNVNLAEVALDVDANGNITIVNSIAMEQTNYWGEVFVDFADFWIGVMPKSLYDTHGNEALKADAGEWGDFMTSATTQRSTGLYNVADIRQYEEGVYEVETLTFTTDQLANAFWPTYNFEVGGEYIIFVALEGELYNYYQIPVLDGAVMVEYKKVLVEAELVEGSEAWNDATFHVSFAGYQNFLVGWMSEAEVEMYKGYNMGSTIEEILPKYIQAYGVMSSGAILAGNYIDQDIKLSELESMSLMQWAPTLSVDTTYYFYVYPFNAETEMEFYQHKFIAENLRIFGTFSTKPLVPGEFDAAAQYEVTMHEEKEIAVNVTLAEDAVSVAYHWYGASITDPEEAVATIMGDEYYTTFVTLDETKSFVAEEYDYYGLDDPIYLAMIVINANGEYVFVEKEFKYVEPVLEQVEITSFEFLGRSCDLDDDETTSGGDYVYTLTTADGNEFTLGLYYSYANTDGSILEGTYEYCTNQLDYMYSSWSGFVIVSDTYYYDSVLTVTADQIIWKIKGVVEYVYNKNAQGGEEPEPEPEEPEEPEEPAELVWEQAWAEGDWDDCTISLYSNQNTGIALNFYGIIPYDKGYIPEGTYDFGGWYGAIYTGGYSYYFTTVSPYERYSIYSGTVAVSEVDGKYRIVIDAKYGDAMQDLHAEYEGLIDGIILPSEYVAPEPEEPAEPAENALNPVRADYDNKFDLYEYNGGDAEYAFWLYDENNNYVEVIHRFGNHTGWDDVYEAKLVKGGVESVATSVETQKPNTWNCNAGELYFKVIATFENGESVYIDAQLPATERNFLGEGSTYAPGSEPEEGGDEPTEPEETVAVELNPYEWFKSYSGGNELEIGWFDQDGYSIMIDFLMNPVTPGTYTLGTGLSGMYCKYRGIGMTTCTVVVTDAGDDQLAFDVNFKAQIEGVFTDYHFTWVGDPSTL